MSEAMKTIMITAPASGSGKTTMTLGLIRALKKRSIDVCGFKAGPDYIDRAFLENASGKPGGNLDLHLQGEKGLFHSLSRAQAEFCVIEGVMGFFDGIYNTFQNSCYHISDILKINSILVYTPKGEMFSAIPKIKGMADFGHSSIKAVIFNNVTEKTYLLLKDALENYTDLKALGYLPKLKNCELKSRHLGLVQSMEIQHLHAKLDEIAAAVEDHIDLDAILGLMTQPRMPVDKSGYDFPKTDIKVAIAMDSAFSFYYQENLELLEESCNVTYFSPLKDHTIPICDLLYFGGGYPEVFREKLSLNKSMMTSVKEFAESDGYILAECGGLMYLSEYIEETKMVGLFKGKCHMTQRLQRFGYVDIELAEDCFLGVKGDKLVAHEFHRSRTSIETPTVFQVSKTKGPQKWSCGFQYKNTIAGYPHFNFLGNPKSFHHLLNQIGKNKKVK